MLWLWPEGWRLWLSDSEESLPPKAGTTAIWRRMLKSIHVGKVVPIKLQPRVNHVTFLLFETPRCLLGYICSRAAAQLPPTPNQGLGCRGRLIGRGGTSGEWKRRCLKRSMFFFSVILLGLMRGSVALPRHAQEGGRFGRSGSTGHAVEETQGKGTGRKWKETPGESKELKGKLWKFQGELEAQIRKTQGKHRGKLLGKQSKGNLKANVEGAETARKSKGKVRTRRGNLMRKIYGKVRQLKKCHL